MDPTLLTKVFGSLAAVLWLVSAVFWAFSARVEIRDNINAFIGDLQRAGRLNAWAAASGEYREAAGVGAQRLRQETMADPSPSASPPPPMSPQVANIHKSIYDALIFAKKQQWAITNYVVLSKG